MKDRHVNVVTARVHDVDFFALVIFRHDFARVGQAGFLLDRQCIQVGAHEHGRPVAVFHHADDAVTFQARVVDISRSFRSPRSRPLSSSFATIAAVRCSWVDNSGLRMQILVNSEKRRQLALGEGLWRLLREKRRGETEEGDSDRSESSF